MYCFRPSELLGVIGSRPNIVDSVCRLAMIENGDWNLGLQ
jgi:hypothetical protein